jgi:hypothetical protein
MPRLDSQAFFIIWADDTLNDVPMAESLKVVEVS